MSKASKSEQKEALSKKLALPLTLEESGPPRFHQNLMVIGGVFLGLAIVWASITEIKELARANGEVTPAGQVQLIQHLEGGIVAEILVDEGEIVELDQPIIRLQPVAAEGDLGQLMARQTALTLKMARLSAFIDDSAMSTELEGLDSSLFAHEAELLTSSRAAAELQREGLISRIEQKAADIDSFSDQRDSLHDQVQLLVEEVTMREELVEKGLVSRIAYLETKRSLEQTRVQYISAAGSLASSREGLREAETALEELNATLINDALRERTDAAAELSETNSAIAKLQDRVTRLTVRAPIKGIVQELSSGSVGTVVEPGGLIAQLVPVDDELVAEVKVSPNDIGHVEIGDEAQVKITTYDAARFGAIEGEVRRISASTFRNEDGEPYYKVIIGLARAHVGGGSDTHAVLPGMVVNAEIVTGSKSLVRYLLKPVYRSLDTAFTER